MREAQMARAERRPSNFGDVLPRMDIPDGSG
jgi:hypothetical protein